MRDERVELTGRLSWKCKLSRCDEEDGSAASRRG